MLKHIIPRSSIEGNVKTLKANHESAVSSISQQTMGNLVKRFVDNVCKEEGFAEEDEAYKPELFSFKFTISMDEESYRSKKEALECVVKERNDLIHHMLSKFDQNSTQSCLALAARLDEQYSLIKNEYEYLRNMILNFHEVSKLALQEIEKEFIAKSKSKNESA